MLKKINLIIFLIIGLLSTSCGKNIDELLGSLTSSDTPTWSSIAQIGVASKVTKIQSAAVGTNNISTFAGVTTTNLVSGSGSSTGSQDLFVTQYGAIGTQVWTKQLGVSAKSVDNAVIAVDGSGNSVVAVTTDANLATGSGASTGTKDLYVIKYDSSGNKLWDYQSGIAAKTTQAKSIAVDSNSNVYITGKTDGNLETGAGAATGTFESFALKLDSSGTKQWLKQEGKTGGKTTIGNGVAVDTNGNVAITGETDDGLDGSALRGVKDGFIIQYDHTGTKSWTKQHGLATKTTIFNSVDTDTTNHVIAAGNTTDSTSAQDIMVVKYDSLGTHNWTKKFGNAGAKTSTSHGVKTDSDNNVIIGGETNDDLENGGAASTGTVDGALIKLDSSGNKLWARQRGQSSKTTIVNSVDVNSKGYIMTAGETTGHFSGTGSATGTNDGFAGQFNPSGTLANTIVSSGGGGGGGGGGSAIAATYVIGQANMTSGSDNQGGTTAANSLSMVNGNVAVDGNGKLYITDQGNTRVLVYNSIPAANNVSADFVIGQADLVSHAQGATDTTLNNPMSVSIVGTSLYVADSSNFKIKKYALPIAANGATATVVAGSSNAVSATQFASAQCAVATATSLLVADSNRIALWPGSVPASSATGATYFLGQTLATGSGVNAGGLSASSINTAQGIWSDGTKVAIADTNNHRVLIWNTFPTSSNQAADLVLGQADFTHNSMNRTGNPSPVAGNTLASPASVYFDGTKFLVSDSSNNRVLIWNSWPTTNGQTADAVLGAATLTTYSGSGTTSTQLHGPTGAIRTGTSIIVTDRWNYRVLIYTGM